MSAFLSACRRQPTDFTPIWIMRQAGRYQPEYRKLREKVGFIELCKRPDLAAEVTIRAVEQLGVDAGIIFADILLILEPLGVGFHFTENDGPRIDRPIRTGRQIDLIHDEIPAEQCMPYVMESIRRVCADLKVPLIGFCGAPFTLASYVIEGGGSKNYFETKRIMYGDPDAWHVLMEKLTRASALYLNAQIQAGAAAVQVFDSWVGCLGPDDYRRFVYPHMVRLFQSITTGTPVIHFGTGNPSLYPLMAEAGGDVMGVDWRVDLGTEWRRLGAEKVAIMGNLDPASVLVPRDVMEARANDVLKSAGARAGHVFNLGHGIMPEASVDQVRALVDYVHEASAR